MDIKRGKSLYMIFLGYLISFCILSIIWIFSLVAFINISVNKDIIKPANYMENQVEKLKLEAKQGLKFDSSKIPYSRLNDPAKTMKVAVGVDVPRFLNAESGVGKHITGTHFAVVGAVMHDLSLSIYLVETAWKKHGTV